MPAPRLNQYVPRGDIETEVRDVLQRTNAAAVVGVSGMGGLGKTELARQLASEWQDQGRPVMWVPISDRSLEDVQQHMARALGIEIGPRDDVALRAAEIKNALGRTRWLVVLDDVRKGFVTSLEHCLPPRPPCAVLVTSRCREFSALPPGVVRDLDVMTPKQSLEVLRSVSGLADALEQEPDAASRLCAACGHHPLALDLASRRLLARMDGSARPVAAFVDELASRATQLAVGTGPLESLSVNFDLSYAELAPEDQTRWRRLAVFAPTGFSVEAAAALWSLDFGKARAALERFRSLSLLLPGPGVHGGGPLGRNGSSMSAIC